MILVKFNSVTVKERQAIIYNNKLASINHRFTIENPVSIDTGFFHANFARKVQKLAFFERDIIVLKSHNISFL